MSASGRHLRLTTHSLTTANRRHYKCMLQHATRCNLINAPKYYRMTPQRNYSTKRNADEDEGSNANNIQDTTQSDITQPLHIPTTISHVIFPSKTPTNSKNITPRHPHIPKISRTIFHWTPEQQRFLFKNIPHLSFSKTNFRLLTLIAFQHPLYASILRHVNRLSQKPNAPVSAFRLFVLNNRDAINEYAREHHLMFLQASRKMYKEKLRKDGVSEEQQKRLRVKLMPDDPTQKPQRRQRALNGMNLFVAAMSSHVDHWPENMSRLAYLAAIWRKLSKHERMIYDMMANEMNLENAAELHKPDKEAAKRYKETYNKKKSVEAYHESIKPRLAQSEVFTGDVDHAILALDKAFPDEGILKRYLEFIESEEMKGGGGRKKVDSGLQTDVEDEDLDAIVDEDLLTDEEDVGSGEEDDFEGVEEDAQREEQQASTQQST